MMRSPDRGGEGKLEWKRPLCRGILAVPVLAALLLALAALQARDILPDGRETLWARLCLLLCAVLGGLRGAVCAGQKKLYSAALGECALLLFVILLGVFTKNGSVFNISLINTISILICGSFLGSLFSAAGGKRRRKHI